MAPWPGMPAAIHAWTCALLHVLLDTPAILDTADRCLSFCVTQINQLAHDQYAVAGWSVVINRVSATASVHNVVGMCCRR